MDEIATGKQGKDDHQVSLNDGKERFFTPTILKQQGIATTKPKLTGRKDKNGNVADRVDLAKYVDEMYQKYVLKLPIEERNMLYTNCLIILDDMVSQIKA